MAGVEAVKRGVPDFGPVVRREHILSASRLGAPALTVVCAPPGYGKSVLAAQLIAESSSSASLWIRLYDSDVRGDEWLCRIAEALSPACLELNATSDPRPQFNPDPARGEAMLRIRDGLVDRAGQDFTVVLDGANRIGDLTPFMDLADLLRKQTAPTSRVIVTCRSVSRDNAAPDPATVWVVDMEDLRFNDTEVGQLLTLAGHGDDSPSMVGRLLDRFAGHPALTALMVRHSRIDDEADPPQDLVWHTRRLVAQLEPSALGMAFGAALLREGTAVELESCLRAANLGDVDWRAMQALAPMLRIVHDDVGTAAGFGTHAVLCDAVLAESMMKLDPDGCRRLRAAVLSYLTQSLDFGRLAGTLHSACDGEEVARWCEVNGMALLHQCGATAVERCLGKVSPLRISSSARLLLLRSAGLREQERSDEALTHVSLVFRIAEADEDFDTQASALLFAVRLALDAADLLRARHVVRQLDGTLRSRLSEPEACLLDAYIAVLEAQGGNSEVADSHARRAASILARIDKSIPEAAWSASCLAGVMGQLHGRWDEAGALLARVPDWPGTTRLQALQCRANAAWVHLELGSTSQCESLVRGVLEDAKAAGLHVMGAYALGTLSSVVWLTDRLESQALWRETQRVFNSRGDLVGANVESINRSALCRAESSGEEALAHAEAALAQLRERDDSMWLFRISAETEVAASMLALGDRWGAGRIASRIESELQGAAAAAHLLTVEMVLAEIDRLDGDPAAAVDRLTGFADYIATGSANWRTAIYIRGFPGLLGIFVHALGAEHLPLRMVRLIPEDVIETACALCDGAISAAERQVLLARASGSEFVPKVIEAAPPGPSCQVRLFGGFEVFVNGHRIDDVHWRKRKVRVVFAMLAARRGQDLPRDVVLECLWPGMDEERARRNFYVTWSGMKRALASAPGFDSAHPFAICTSGVCRVTSAVRSDLDDLEETVEYLRAANVIEDVPGVLSAARRLLGIYRGDLLPGDIYEEWFSDVRERARHEFCDAMLIAAQAAEGLHNTTEALAFLRRAGAIDPWREDIYQTTMRCQMGAGQRSRAIETYLVCRGRLVDDLGIDPSIETTRLYEAVLAMDSDDGVIDSGV